MGSCEMTHWQKVSILQEFFPISLQNFQSRKGSVTSLSGSHSSRANFGLIWIQRHLQICKHRRLKMLPVFIAKNSQCLTVLKIRKARSRHLYISYSLKKLKGEDCSPVNQYSVRGHWSFHFSFLSFYSPAFLSEIEKSHENVILASLYRTKKQACEDHSNTLSSCTI